MSAWRVIALLVVVLGVCVCTWFRTTEPSACRNAAPGVGLDFRSLPTEVKRFGKELFGSRNSFLRLLNRTQPPTAVKIADGRCMWLVQHPKDNSLQRLSREVPKDEYQLARLHFPISRGGLMVDVGARLGDQSIAAHLWDPGLQVLAIEPVPLTFLFLLLNLHLNALQRGQIDRRLAWLCQLATLALLGPHLGLGAALHAREESHHWARSTKSPHLIAFPGRPDTQALVFGCAYCRPSPTARRRATARCHREQRQPLR